MNINQINFISSVSRLVFELFDCSHDVALFIGSQAALESSYGTSAVATANQNIFGMKTPRLRGHTPYASTTGIDKSFAAYDSIYLSVVDYILWLQYNRISNKQRNKLECFTNFLVSKGYCPDDGYIDSITAVFNSYNVSKKKFTDESI